MVTRKVNASTNRFACERTCGTSFRASAFGIGMIWVASILRRTTLLP
jgi:hypothetical protein